MSVEYHMQGILIDILCEDHEYCMNIGEYCPKQYIILHKHARDNIHAITLLLYSNKYFFFRSVSNTVKI